MRRKRSSWGSVAFVRLRVDSPGEWRVNLAVQAIGDGIEVPRGSSE